MFRWAGIIFLAVFAGIIFLLGWFFTDAWLENQLEESASALNGAKVEIDNLDFSLFGPKLSWDKLQVTDPKSTMKNMLETGFCEFNMEFWPLLSKKVIIDNIQLSDLRTNTDRETDGKIERETVVEEIAESNYVQETVNRLEDKVKSTPALQLAGQVKSVNVDSILAILNITAVQKIDSLQTSMTGKYDTWQKEIATLGYDKELKDIEQKVKSFDVNKLKGIEDYRSALNSVEQINATLNTVSKDFQTKKSTFTSDLANLKSGVLVVDDWVASDYKSALSMAKLPEINTKNMAEMIFGETVVGQFTQYLGYVAEARMYANKFKSDKPEKQDSPRLKGQDIYFYNQYARPDFWIKNIDLSGKTENQINLSGVVKNIVSDQKQINAQTEMTISGSGDKGSSLTLNGSLNYLEDTPKEYFNVSYAGFSLANTKISSSNLLPNAIKKGTGKIESFVKLNGDIINGEVKFTGQKLEFDLSQQGKPNNKVDEIIQSIVKSIDMVDVLMMIQGKGDNLKFRINSNLDDLFVKKMNSILSGEVAAAKEKLMAKIDAEVTKYKSQLNYLISEKEKMITAEIKKYEDMINEKKEMVDKKKKEIENKIEKEKGKQLKKVKDVLKF